jgi:hypothetical protein
MGQCVAQSQMNMAHILTASPNFQTYSYAQKLARLKAVREIIKLHFESQEQYQQTQQIQKR